MAIGFNPMMMGGMNMMGGMGMMGGMSQMFMMMQMMQMMQMMMSMMGQMSGGQMNGGCGCGHQGLGGAMGMPGPGGYPGADAHADARLSADGWVPSVLRRSQCPPDRTRRPPKRHPHRPSIGPKYYEQPGSSELPSGLLLPRREAPPPSSGRQPHRRIGLSSRRSTCPTAR